MHNPVEPQHPLPSQVGSGLVTWPADQLRDETSQVSACFLPSLERCLPCAISGGVLVGGKARETAGGPSAAELTQTPAPQGKPHRKVYRHKRSKQPVSRFVHEGVLTLSLQLARVNNSWVLTVPPRFPPHAGPQSWFQRCFFPFALQKQLFVNGSRSINKGNNGS